MKVRIVNPITHNGVEYGRGVCEVPDELVTQWQKEAPHVLAPLEEETVAVVSKAPDANPNLSQGQPRIDTLNLNVEKAIEFVQSQTDVPTLKLLAIGEGQNPRQEGGRKGVLLAISTRITELESAK